MVDLIPEDYRRGLRLRRMLRGFGCACAALVLLAAAARAGLEYAVRTEQRELEAVRGASTASGAQRSRLAGLEARREAMQREVDALEMLRGRGVIGELFVAIDTAVTQRIWFDELTFSRDSLSVEAGANARAPGTSMPVARETPGQTPNGGNPAGERMGLARHRAQIRGHALDHSTLADFISRLAEQPGIGALRLVDTGARSYSGAQVVDFQLAASLGPRDGGSR